MYVFEKSQNTNLFLYIQLPLSKFLNRLHTSTILQHKLIFSSCNSTIPKPSSITSLIFPHTLTTHKLSYFNTHSTPLSPLLTPFPLNTCFSTYIHNPPIKPSCSSPLQPPFFYRMPSTLLSLFWSMFGLVGVDSVEIKYPSKNEDTINSPMHATSIGGDFHYWRFLFEFEFNELLEA